ncbi:hypothetical protein [Pelodictyon luteolum]|uniref:Porin n=1 Tax=Chlorobium luteolum (strain DSM 273 / BCRC 81028 / 2530) TaxID=319225 RepID=Q3B3Q4_CHLL3|nr:hypothetical protein [Pelodictyon luteolum]ABB24027.1 conserved hypothetical protein [Pelodictyon luteolum DSM 273]
MRKTAKFLTLAVALAATFTGTAKADEGFSIGADIISTYVWRGTELSDSPSIQPSLSYTFSGIGIEIGAWGSYAIDDKADGTRYKEIDLYASVPVGPVTLTVTDYCDAAADNSFDFSQDGPNVVELSASYGIDDLSLLAAINVAGKEGSAKNAVYCEAGYQFYDKDGYTASGVIGAGDQAFYGDTLSNGFTIVNTGISVSKDRYTASYVYNPDSEKSVLAFMASF